MASMEAISESAHWKWILVVAIAPIAWGSNYFVTRQFLPPDLPVWGAVLRALPAGLVLLVLARRLPRGSWWWRSIVLGVLNVGAFFVLIYLAAQLLPSSIAATIMASSAVVMMLVAWPLLAERPAIAPSIGAVVGLGGVALMLLDDTAGVNAGGVAASGAAMLMSSLGFVLTKRWVTTESTLAVTSWQLIAGGAVLVPVALLLEGGVPVLDAPAIAAFAYVSVIATAVAFVAWFAGLRHLPAATVGLVGLLNPVTGVLLGTLIANEVFGVRQVVGTCLVLGGVLLGQAFAIRRDRFGVRMPSPAASQTPVQETRARRAESLP